MASHSAELSAWGWQAVAVSFAPAGRLGAYVARKRWPLPVYGDPDRRLYAALGMGRLPWWRLVGPATLWRYLTAGRRDPYEGDDVRQAGGDALLLPDGRVPFVHRGATPIDRPAWATLADWHRRLAAM